MISVDSYIFRQVGKPVIAALTIALAVLLIERMLQLIDLVLGANGTFRVVLQILAFLVPEYLSLALPISLLLGVMFAFGRLSRDGETDALQAAGISLYRQARPVLLLAMVVAVCSAMVFGYLKPYGRYAYEALVSLVTDSTIQSFIRTGVFARMGDTTFLVEGLSEDGARFERVFVFEQESESETAVIAAQNGSLLRTGVGSPPILRIVDGVRLTTQISREKVSGTPETSAELLQFNRLRTELGSGVAQTFRPRGEDEREMTMGELWERRDDPPPGIRASDIVAEFHGRIVRVLSVFVIPFLGIALATRTGRRDRTWSLAAALVLLILFNQLVDLGENAAEVQQVNVYLGVWGPLAGFAALAAILFHFRAVRVPEGARFGLLTGIGLSQRRPRPAK